MKGRFETKHKRSFKDKTENFEALKKAVSRFEKQSSTFKRVIDSTNRKIESIYKVAEGIAKYGKPLTDEDFQKRPFSVALTRCLMIHHTKAPLSRGSRMYLFLPAQ